MVENSPFRGDGGRLLALTLMICLMATSSAPKSGLLGKKLVQQTLRDYTNGPWFLMHEKLAIMDMINSLRSEVEDAADMMQVDWNNCMEKFAGYWANDCNASDSKKLPDFNDFKTKNLATFALPNLKGTKDNTLSEWYNSKPENIGPQCGKGDQCEQFNKLIWSKSLAVGCAMKTCNPLAGYNGLTNGRLIICLIGPTAVEPKEIPYTTGKACSKCPESHCYCHKQLCSNGKQQGLATCSAETINQSGASIFVTMVTVLVTTAHNCQLR